MTDRPVAAVLCRAMKFALFFLFAAMPVFAEKVGPWDLDALKSTVPAMKWVRQDAPVRSLTIASRRLVMLADSPGGTAGSKAGLTTSWLMLLFWIR